MKSTTTSIEGVDFNICWGRIEPNTSFNIVYRNIEDPDSLNGQITQWLYGVEGTGSAVIDGESFPFVLGDIVKPPQFYNKKVKFTTNNDGAIWVSFNPKPHTDQYDAKKVDILPGTSIPLEAVDYDRHLVLLTGYVAVKLEDGRSIDLTRASSIKLRAGKSVVLESMMASTVGIFTKLN